MQTLDDEKLVRLCLSGDKEAFGHLVRKYQGAIYAFAYHLVGDFTEAEDRAQESFIEAYKSLGSLQDAKKFGAWLRGITSRVCMNWLRSRKGEVAREQGEFIKSEEAEASGLMGRVPAPDELQMDRELREAVRRGIDSLPEQHRLVISLRYLEELSYKEIALFLELPTSTVRGMLYRASRELRKTLKDIGEERGRGWPRARM